jgi:hypothetical protein
VNQTKKLKNGRAKAEKLGLGQRNHGLFLSKFQASMMGRNDHR